jgi:sugar phosphate isomerase/epimerase
MKNSLRALGAQAHIEAVTPQVIEWLNEAGRSLEIDYFAREFVLDDPAAHVAELRRRLDGFSGSFGIHGPVPTPSFVVGDPDIQAIVLKRFGQALDICAEIGATHMVVHSPFLFLGRPYMTHDNKDILALTIRRAADLIGPVAERARERGVTLCLENIFDTAPEPMCELIDLVDSPSLKLSLDIGHAAVASSMAPDFWIKAMGARLAHLHISDSDGQADRHWVPGEGLLPWARMFRELNMLEQDMRLIMEFRVEDRYASVYKRASEWMAANDWAQ